MSNSEEDTYSTVFASLKHPIRRKILRILSNEPESFSGLQKQFRIESSHLTYHIEGLGSLLLKTEDGKYALSSLGEAAVSMMTHVEEPSRTSMHRFFSSAPRPGILKLLTFLLICGLVASLVFSGVMLRKFDESDTAYNRLDKAFTGLNQAYDELNKTYAELNQAYSQLTETYNNLDSAYGHLNETYLALLTADAHVVYDLSTGQNYTKIQDAINAAGNGDTILAGIGVYYEHLLVNKTLTLRGLDKEDTIIDGSNSDEVIAVTADNVLIDSLTVRNSSRINSGIRLDHSNNSTITNSITSANGWAGIELNESNNNTVSDNIVSSTIGETVGLIWGDGIMLDTSTNNSISGNVITDSASDGIYLGRSYNNSVFGNVIQNNDVGIDVVQSGDNMFFHNNFIHNSAAEAAELFSENDTWSIGGEGNYWDNYVGLDDGSGGRVAGDGVGDTDLPWQGLDYYPLIRPVNPIGIFWDNMVFPTSMVGNSTVSAFSFDYADREITFNVVGPANTTGYFNVTIPMSLLGGSWTIVLDGIDKTSYATLAGNQTYTSIYLTYGHSAHNVKIIGTHVIPECSTANMFLLIPLLALPTTILILKKRRACQKMR